MKSPFPWFGGKSRVAHLVWDRFGDVPNYCACIGQAQSVGCLPVIFPALLRVLHRNSRRFSVQVATLLALNSGRCSARWSRLLLSSRLPGSSFSLFRSLWWIPNPLGIGPLSFSQTYCASSPQVFGSAIFMNARRSPFRLCLVRILIDPTGNLLSRGIPLVNLPSKSLILSILSLNYYGGNLWMN